MNINVASVANAKRIKLYFHLKTDKTVENSGTGLKQLWAVVIQNLGLRGKVSGWGKGFIFSLHNYDTLALILFLPFTSYLQISISEGKQLGALEVFHTPLWINTNYNTENNLIFWLGVIPSVVKAEFYTGPIRTRISFLTIEYWN